MLWINVKKKKKTTHTHTQHQFIYMVVKEHKKNRIMALGVYHLYFVKREQPTRISILQKQECGSVLLMTNALRGRISPLLPGLVLKMELPSFYISQETISWMICYTWLNLAQNGSWPLFTKWGNMMSLEATLLGPVTMILASWDYRLHSYICLSCSVNIIF